MNGEISPVTPLIAAPSAKSEKREETAQGDDKRIVPPRYASDVEIVRRADDQDQERRHREFQEKIRAALNLEAQLMIDEDEATGAFVYRIINRETGEQLRQWPREDMLKLSEFFRGLDGQIVDRKV
ncbi:MULTISPECIES: flagellar protein FlaG [Euryhalocaulis]|uniref:flagellar protein FlaG n=1 Tax=Euryhalocaulis TaxID=1712422 RepID=UPI0003A34252|nr:MULTISPECIES: flagellar protein FlaG [Euryhalocaulis]MBA4801466.1 flagellar protein FlaG [Euryhalocaulis sp.]